MVSLTFLPKLVRFSKKDLKINPGILVKFIFVVKLNKSLHAFYKFELHLLSYSFKNVNWDIAW